MKQDTRHTGRRWSTGKKCLLAILFALLCWYACCLPKELFPDCKWSTVVVDRNGELLGARIAEDGQWRFPAQAYDKTEPDGVEKYKTAVIEFEDRWFRWHWGVNPVAICRAMISNAKAGHIVSGGSTLTMQVVRMSRGKERTLRQKFIEGILATRLEFRYSKDEILELYAAHAPFGGNVVGLEAASWRYFGRSASDLSWGEAATLAVLPNAPSNIRLGKNRERLEAKRNRLLYKLKDRDFIGESECILACSEPLPEAPEALPSYASQLVDDIAAGNWNVNGSGKYTRTTLDIHLQREVEKILNRKNDELSREGINDLAAVVIDVKSGDILAYVGNANPDRKRLGANVNIARAPRSSGSILKPFLYCDALSDGTILPYSLLADTPVNINGFTPQNYDMTYEGAVPAAEALSRSLNIPSVHLLKMYGVQKFLERLKERGLTTFGRSASDYGLSLILGGGECRLDEVTAAYATMAREYLAASGDVNSNVELGSFNGVNLIKQDSNRSTRAGKNSNRKELSSGSGKLTDGKAKKLDKTWKKSGESGTTTMFGTSWKPEDDPVALFYTFDALKEVSRPDEIDWHIIRSVKKVAWKTGTSYGYRDAWAVGATPTLAVGVWAGNASGVGAPGLLGARTAGPVMFEIFNILPADGPAWFPSLDDLASSDVHLNCAEICHESGFLAGPYCIDIDTLDIPAAGLHGKPCPYHRRVDGESRFQLTPAMEWFYRQKHPEYNSDSSEKDTDTQEMEFIYPESGSRITLPRQLDGSAGEIVLNLAHHNRDATVYWHIDQDYLGETRFVHQTRIHPTPGDHIITVVDNLGNTLSIKIIIE